MKLSRCIQTLRRLTATLPEYPDQDKGFIEKRFPIVIAFRDERIYINAAQYFGNATERSWNFPIGGYQPAQKWLKERRGRTLSPADVLHYERILRALDLTADIMAEIDGQS